MARDPSATVQAARRHAHRVKRSGGRLLTAGLGFAVAYFFDGAQGRARRRQMVDVVRRVRHRKGVVTPEPAPDLPRIGQADLGPRPTFQRATDGVRVSARV